MGLFAIDTEYVGPGLPLWLPKGTVLELEKLAKETGFAAGYVRFRTPHLGLAAPLGQGLYWHQALVDLHSYPANVSDVTEILTAVERGDPGAADQLLPMVYEELRKLAAQRMAR